MIIAGIDDFSICSALAPKKKHAQISKFWSWYYTHLKGKFPGELWWKNPNSYIIPNLKVTHTHTHKNFITYNNISDIVKDECIDCIIIYRLKDESNLFLFMCCDAFIEELKIYETQGVYIHLSVIGCFCCLKIQFINNKICSTKSI